MYGVVEVTLFSAESGLIDKKITNASWLTFNHVSSEHGIMLIAFSRCEHLETLSVSARSKINIFLFWSDRRRFFPSIYFNLSSCQTYGARLLSFLRHSAPWAARWHGKICNHIARSVTLTFCSFILFRLKLGHVLHFHGGFPLRFQLACAKRYDKWWK